jgi:murein L,D-transpeptidase YafK
MDNIQKQTTRKRKIVGLIPKNFKNKFLFWFLILFLSFQVGISREKYPRVRRAKKDKDLFLSQLFEQKQLPYPPKKIYIRIFKKEQLVELWIWAKKTNSFTLLKSYNFCTTSGILGPKRRQGDLQIPEGFYHIDRFNPHSNFYLSLGINYPNRSDRKRGDKSNPGGDIFIHGSCVTIGCIPITDDKIKELYWVAIQSKRNGQNKIPVHIFPAKLNEINLKSLQQLAESLTYWKQFKLLTGNNHPNSAQDLILFWKNLKQAYDYFEQNKKLPRIRINHQGKYIIN